MLCVFNIFASVANWCGRWTMWSLVSLVILSKKGEINGSYFRSIHAAQNNIPEGDGALIFPSTPAGVVLRGSTVAVCHLHVPYTKKYVYHFVVVLVVSLPQPLNSAVLPMGSSTSCSSHKMSSRSWSSQLRSVRQWRHEKFKTAGLIWTRGERILY